MEETKIELPILPEHPLLSINKLMSEHWRTRQKSSKYWRRVGRNASENLPEMRPPVECHVYIYRARSGRYDPGNYYPTAKAILDGIVDTGILPDDSHEYLDGPHLHHGGVDRENPRLEIFFSPYERKK
nr:MAG TPA: Endodeoxyribonuclease RusA [Caudoviricetes sp.]